MADIRDEIGKMMSKGITGDDIRKMDRRKVQEAMHFWSPGDEEISKTVESVKTVRKAHEIQVAVCPECGSQDAFKKGMMKACPECGEDRVIGKRYLPAKKSVKDNSYCEGEPKQGWHSHDIDEDSGVAVDHVKGRRKWHGRMKPATIGGSSPFDDASAKQEAANRAKKKPPVPERPTDRGAKYDNTGSTSGDLGKVEGDTVPFDLLKAAVIKNMGG